MQFAAHQEVKYETNGWLIDTAFIIAIIRSQRSKSHNSNVAFHHNYCHFLLRHVSFSFFLFHTSFVIGFVINCILNILFVWIFSLSFSFGLFLNSFSSNGDTNITNKFQTRLAFYLVYICIFVLRLSIIISFFFISSSSLFALSHIKDLMLYHAIKRFPT